MLTQLTPQQEQLMLEKKNEWLDYINSCQHSTDREQAAKGIKWLYTLSNLKEPIIIFVDSPLACQYAAPMLKNLLPKSNSAQVGAQVRDQVWDQVGDQVRAQVRDQVGDQVWAQVGDQVGDQVRDQVGDQVWAQVRAQVWDQVGDQVRAQVRAQVWDQVGAQVRDQVWDQVRDQVWDQVGDQYEPFSQYGNIWDYGWVSFYDFFQAIGVVNHELFSQYKQLLRSGIYDMVQLNGCCIVSNMPDKIKRDARGRLHCEDGSAIHFRDGYELYFWHGAAVPKRWIMQPETITSEDITTTDNAEKRRCLMEIIGAERYYEALGGVVVIDEDTDDQGNRMRLFQTKKADDIIKKKVVFLECVCPSTMRVYNIYPPDQKVKNVWAAKASTFNNKKIQVRHGDVGLLNLEKKYDKPILES